MTLQSCPICRRTPELRWSHSASQLAGHPAHGPRQILHKSFHRDALPLYACPECNCSTKPQGDENSALRAWNKAANGGGGWA